MSIGTVPVCPSTLPPPILQTLPSLCATRARNAHAHRRDSEPVAVPVARRTRVRNSPSLSMHLCDNSVENKGQVGAQQVLLSRSRNRGLRKPLGSWLGIPRATSRSIGCATEANSRHLGISNRRDESENNHRCDALRCVGGALTPLAPTFDSDADDRRVTLGTDRS